MAVRLARSARRARRPAVITALGCFVLATQPTLGTTGCRAGSSNDRTDGRADAGSETDLSGGATVAGAAVVTGGAPCGALDCMQYDSPRQAFLQALALAGARSGPPLVLAMGEAHPPRGATATSAATHFTRELLPALVGGASDLLLELMMPPSGCVDAVAAVRTAEEPVTSRHAESAPDEYVTMGERARALGIVPDMLRPTCADMDAMQDAAAIDVSLTTIARLSRAQAIRLVDRDELSDADRGKMVVLYGGALHNDLSPPPELAPWSYAPEVDAHVHGRFVAIDLVVPEFIGSDETWARLPWWPHYDRARLGQKATLFNTSAHTSARTGPQSFVLVFPAGQ